jgi:hypothetical protein
MTVGERPCSIHGEPKRVPKEPTPGVNAGTLSFVTMPRTW